MSYTITGFINDLYFILITQTNNLPWNDSKYIKRFGRLCYLVIFNYLTLDTTKIYNKKLRILKKLITIIENDFDNKKKMKDIILETFRYHLYNISLTKEDNYKDYMRFKKFIITKLKLILEFLYREEIQIKNFNLHKVNNINSTHLNVKYPLKY
jgi:hypothetical protein